MPDSIRSCGLLMAPPRRMISFLAVIVTRLAVWTGPVRRIRLVGARRIHDFHADGPVPVDEHSGHELVGQD